MNRTLPAVLSASAALLVSLPAPARAATGVSPRTTGDEVPAGSLAERVAAHYVHLAHRRYEDALAGAELLRADLQAFLKDPSAETHAAAKRAWIEAHGVYSHTEVLRFGNPNVDAWEARVNAWPMDEGLIDYVDERYVFHEGNPHARDNIVGTSRQPITDELIAEYQSGVDPKAAPLTTISDIESNVTRGFHAIEFLLWGQDLNDPPGTSGQRTHTDYLRGEGCTPSRCGRRREYLSAATRLLIADLRFILRDWQPDGSLYAKRFGALPLREQLDRMIVGMGTLSFGELAAERIEVALLTYDQEEEQNCFSDSTHLALYHNAKAVETLYLGRHECLDGEVVEGPSLADLVAELDPRLDRQLRGLFARTDELVSEIVAAAEAGEHFDQMILADNEAGRARLFALMDRLREQTEVLEVLRGRLDELAAL